MSARAHAAVVCTMVWYRDALDSLGRTATAERIRLLSARLARRSPGCAVTERAIHALREVVHELARPRPDRNKLVALLRDVIDEVGHVPGTLESVKDIIARLTDPGSGETARPAG